MAPSTGGTQAAAATTSSASSSSAAGAAAASQDAKSTKAAPLAAAAAAPSSDPIADTPGEAALLVSEFPPPPHYYRRAAVDNATGRLRIKPPKIPHEALARGTRRAKAAADRARAEAEAERLRQGESSEGDDKTGAILGGVARTGNNDEDDNNNDDNVVAVFGEIVEDPLLVEPLDPCDDPTVVRDEVKRLNEHVLQLFVTLVQDLVHRPAENKYVVAKMRDIRTTERIA
jgi:hypothetical protein